MIGRKELKDWTIENYVDFMIIMKISFDVEFLHEQQVLSKTLDKCYINSRVLDLGNGILR